MILPTLGNDTLFGTAGDDFIDLLAGDDYYEGGAGLDLIAGGLGNDILYGGAGSDYFFGDPGRDEMHGGEDNDYFFNFLLGTPDTNATAMTIDDGEVFDGGEGFDGIFLLDPTGLTFAFGHTTLSSIESLSFEVADGVFCHAWFLASQVGEGLSTNLLLFSQPGEGNTLQIDFVMDSSTSLDLSVFTVGFAGENDAIFVIGDHDAETITGSMARDFLFGNGGNDILNGGAGNDRLDGGAGVDILAGGSGDDDYYVDVAGEQINEVNGEGIDTVYASTNYTLGAGNEIEILRAFGTSTWNGITLTGNEFNNIIEGELGNDTLNGGLGDDTLDGYHGNDLLNGGNGIDTASYQSVTWEVTVNLASTSWQNTRGGGTDRLLSIENLTGSNFNDTLTGNTLANILDGAGGEDIINGGAGNDSLFGGEGNDRLTGGAGVDVMDGGVGNDTYYVDNADDQTIEFYQQGIADRVFASVNYVLSQSDEIEYLYANAGGAGLALTGNDGDNRIYGNSLGGNDTLDGLGGNDILDGRAGNDILIGGFGNDRLIGGTGDDIIRGRYGIDTMTGGDGNDSFVFDTPDFGPDRITDFNVAYDRISLDSAVFTAIPASGPLSSAAFRIGTAAQDADDRFIYNSVSGSLFYDSNGNAAGGQIRIATLQAGLALTSNNFEII